jgi:anti-sigma factor ChrR (cupin superfamily)
MLSCKDIFERASRYHDGDCGWRERLSIRLHLAICVHCRRYLKQLATTIRLVANLPPSPPEAPAMEDLMQRFRAAAAQRPGTGGGP